MPIRIGIQGSIGSTNEAACQHFIHKYTWKNAEIIPLITTQNVLSSLQNDAIDFGTFAWKSNTGLVAETQKAIQKYEFEKIDQISISPNHALLGLSPLNHQQQVHIYSHPQALKEHTPFLSSYFHKLSLHPEIDTAVAALNICSGFYPPNSAVIAPKQCAHLYQLTTLMSELPANSAYRTTIYLVKKGKK